MIYHIVFFSVINKAAFVFGGLFVLQGCLLFYEAFFRNRFQLASGKQARIVSAYVIMLFGLIVYPLISYFAKESLLTTITPGLPCPTVILSFGVFLLAGKKLL